MTPRARLNREVVVDAAETLVDAEGAHRLTMTALAKGLEVQVPSLYNHVESLDDVLSAVQVRAHQELADEMQRAAMGRSGPDAMRAIASAFRDFATSHPGLYDLAMSEAIDRDLVVAASEPSGAALAAVIASFGVPDLSPELAMSCVATLHGVIALGRAQLFGESVDREAVFERGVDLVVDMLQGEERDRASERVAAS